MAEPVFKIPRDPFFEAKFFGASTQPLPPVFRTDNLHFYFLARNVLFHALELFGTRSGDQWLLPAYHCRALVEPVIASGVEVVYYDVRDDGAIDVSELEARITPKTRGILAVHYLGFPQPMNEVRELCDRHYLKLIEDCAHVLSGEVAGKALGTFGDVSVFSLRKFLPVYDGGVLVVNDQSLVDPAATANSIKHELRSFKTLFDCSLAWNPSVAHRIGNKLWTSGWSFLKQMRKLAPTQEQSGPSAEAAHLGIYSAAFQKDNVRTAMSSVSKILFLHTKFGDVIRARQENYRFLRDTLTRFPGIQAVYPDPEGTICPWVLGITASRENFHLALRQRGVPATTWVDVIYPELLLNDFPRSRRLYENLIFLPIHQSLTARDLEFIADTVRAALAA